MSGAVLLGLFLLVALFSLSYLLTGYFRHYALAKGLVAIPNQRSSHTLPTPCGGGVVFVGLFIFAVFILSYWKGYPPMLLWIITVGGGLIAIIGYIDDYRHVPALWRIVVHVIAAAWALWHFKGLPPITFLSVVIHWPWLNNLVGLGALVWFTNLYNFMDGIDGLAAAEALFIAFAMMLLFALNQQFEMLWMFAALAVCVGGLLVWNWPSARVFMGDVGAGFLGYFFGVMMIYSSCHYDGIHMDLWVILLGVFIVDATLTLLRRMMAGEKWYQAHNSHAFQHAVRVMGSHKSVTKIVIGINCFWLLPIALIAFYRFDWATVATFIALTPLVIFCFWLRAGINGLKKNVC